MFEVYQLAHQVLAMLGYSGDGLVQQWPMPGDNQSQTLPRYPLVSRQAI